jgi:hypothetical protein
LTNRKLAKPADGHEDFIQMPVFIWLLHEHKQNQN